MKSKHLKNPFYAIVIAWLLTAWLVTLAMADEVAEVKYVLDGDTIILMDGRHVRYQGIDAPEIAHDDQPADPFGEDSRLYNEKLVKNQKVRLKIDKQHTDHYDRILAQVFLLNGTWINKAMVAEGLAYVCLYDKENPTALSIFKELLAAQQAAISAKKGMWALPPSKSEAFYVGNKKTMRVHRPHCPSALQTAQSNKIVFKNRNDAYMQGFCPCRKCKP